MMICVLILCLIFVSSFAYTFHQITKEDETDGSITIMIDAGHGGYDTGAIGIDGSYEKNITLKLAQYTGKWIETLDSRIHVVYTRESDVVPWPEQEVEDLRYRVSMAENQNVDYYLSIHCNSSENTDASGYSFYIRTSDMDSLKISHNISDNLKKLHWSNLEGIENTTNHSLYVVDQLSIPSMLFESGYLSNSSECSKLNNFLSQLTISYSLAKGYVDYINAKEKGRLE